MLYTRNSAMEVIVVKPEKIIYGGFVLPPALNQRSMIRSENGDSIWTSTVMDIQLQDTGATVETMNTMYKVIYPAGHELSCEG